MTFEERFEKISTKFKKADTSVLTNDFAIQVNMTDEDCGGIFYIANINGNFSVEPYDYYDHTSLLTIAADDFMKVVSGNLSIENSIIKGRFSVEGNVDDIKILPAMFPKAIKKATVKKTEEIKVAKAPATKVAKAPDAKVAKAPAAKEKTNGKGRKL